MANYVLIAEATQHVPYTREHISLLIREGKVKGQKIGGIWTVDLDNLKEHHQKMEDLGTKRYNPHKQRIKL